MSAHRRWVGLVAVAAVLAVDLGPTRFPEVAAGRWIVLAALTASGIWASRALDVARLCVAERLLIASFAWVLLVAPLSPDPWRSTVVAGALAGTTLLGIAAGRRASWDEVRSAAVAGLTMVLMIAAVLGDRGSFDGRWLGLSEEANSLGEVAALATVLGASMMTDKSWWGLPAVVLGALVLLQTAAAIPALAAVIGMVAAVAPVLNRARAGLAKIVGIGVTGLYAAAGLAIVVLDVEQLGSQGLALKSLNRRTGIWSFLGEKIADRPFVGYGPWGGQDLLAASPFDGRIDWGPTHGHNVFVELATMGGLPAAGLFLAAAVVLGWSLMRAPHPSVAVAVTLATMSMTEHLVATPSIALFLLAVVAGAVSHRPNQPVERAGPLTDGPVKAATIS